MLILKLMRGFKKPDRIYTKSFRCRSARTPGTLEFWSLTTDLQSRSLRIKMISFFVNRIISLTHVYNFRWKMEPKAGTCRKMCYPQSCHNTQNVHSVKNCSYMWELEIVSSKWINHLAQMAINFTSSPFHYFLWAIFILQSSHLIPSYTFFFSLFWPCHVAWGSADLSSPTRDRTWALGSESAGS